MKINFRTLKKTILVIIICTAITAIIDIFLVPVVIKTENKENEREKEFKSNLSPFFCNSCKHALTDYDVDNFKGGAIKGKCPYCGITIMDNMLYGNNPDVSSAWLDYVEKINDKFYENHSRWGLGWGGFILVNLLLIGISAAFISAALTVDKEAKRNLVENIYKQHADRQ